MIRLKNNCCTTFVWFPFTLYFFSLMCYQTKSGEYCFICSISEKCLTVFLFFCLTVLCKSNSKTSVWSNKISVWKRRKKCLIRQKNKKTRSVNGPLHVCSRRQTSKFYSHPTVVTTRHFIIEFYFITRQNIMDHCKTSDLCILLSTF